MTSVRKCLHQSLSLVIVPDEIYPWVDVVQIGDGGGGQLSVIGGCGAEAWIRRGNQ